MAANETTMEGNLLPIGIGLTTADLVATIVMMGLSTFLRGTM